MTREEQLEQYVDRTAGPEACWPWTRAVQYRGYGVVPSRKGRTSLAHRAMWEYANQQDAPKDMVVRHTCDNAICCNPAHLILGTAADNVHDAIARGRRRYIVGSTAARAKLTEAQVLDIRRALRDGATLGDLANEFGVTTDNIRCIRDWKTWKHVTLDEGIKLWSQQIAGTLEDGVRLYPGAYPIPIGPQPHNRQWQPTMTA